MELPMSFAAIACMFVLLACVATASRAHAEESATRSSGWSINTVDPLIKVFQDTPAPSDQSAAKAEVARGECASFQIVVHSTQAIRGLTAKPGEISFRGAKGVKVAASARYVGYVDVDKPMSPPQNLHAVPGEFPDPLLEDPTINVPARQNQPIWISVPVPVDAEPGEHAFTVTIIGSSGSRKLTQDVPLSIMVSSATVVKSRLLFANWGPHPGGRNYYDKEPKPESDSKQYREQLRRYARNMAAHRQSGFCIEPTRYIDYSLGAGNELVFDFHRFDDYVSIFIEEGVDAVIQGAGIASRSDWFGQFTVPIYRKSQKTGRIEHASVAPNDAQAERFYSQFLPAFWSHLKEKGWDKIYTQMIGDEAIVQNISSWCDTAKMCHKYMPDARYFDTMHSGLGSGAEYNEWCKWVNIAVPGPDMLQANPEMFQAEFSKTGRQLWFYTCWQPQGAYANRFIEQPLILTRLLHWLNFKYQAAGYLHWAYNVWNVDNPLRKVIHPSGNHPQVAGDGWIVYPKKGGVLDSIRHEAMRDGIADHELLSQLRERDPAAAERIQTKIVRSFTDYELDVKTFRAARRELLEALSAK
jgi:hypothetical protein